jgi:[NiFe] hydrogenase diaphorase moiety small subunit
VRASRDHDGKRVFAISGRGLDSRLVVDSPSERLADSSFATEDKAAHVCPVGAILPRDQGFGRPIGKRLYDLQPISIVGDVAAHAKEGGEHE